MLAAIELSTAPEFANFLLDGLFKNSSVGAHLARIYASDEGVDSHLWSWIAELDGDPVGAIGAYPTKLLRKPTDTGEAAARLAQFAPISEAMRPDAFHISRLGVLDGYRRMGIAQKLIEAACKTAGSHGEKLLTLFVWENNTGALRLYQRLGFCELQRVTIDPHPRLQRDGVSLMLGKEIG